MPGEARALLRRGRVVALQWKRLPLQQEGQAQGFSMGIDPMTLCCGIWCCGPALCRLCVPFGF